MADLVGTCQSIFGLVSKIKDMVATFRTNQEDCGRIRMLVETAQAVVEPLKQTQPNKGMSAALKGLEKALERSSEVVKTCQKKCTIRGYIEANGITKDLLRAYVDISVNVGLVNLANNINNRLMLTGIMKTLAELDAKSLEIIDAHLRQEVKNLVHIYRSSTEYASEQNNKKRGTQKTDVASIRSEVKNEKVNVPAADMKAPHAYFLSDGSAKSTSAKTVIGQGVPSIANKDSSHRSNPASGAGSIRTVNAPSSSIRDKSQPEYHGHRVKDSSHRSNPTSGAGSIRTLNAPSSSIRDKSQPEYHDHKVKDSSHRSNLASGAGSIRIVNAPSSSIRDKSQPEYHGHRVKDSSHRSNPASGAGSIRTVNAPSSSIRDKSQPEYHDHRVKDSSHRSNPVRGAGSIRKKENNIKKLCGPNTTGSNKIEITNVPADSNGSRASLSYAKYTSLKSVDGQGHPRMVNKMTSRSTDNMTWVTSIDVHPAKPWIVTGHRGGNVSIWDYQKQETVMKKLVTKEPSGIANFMHTCSQYIKEKAAKHWVCSVKFITQQKWLAVGDGSGYIHVYDYTNTELPEVKKFEVYYDASVDSLAVHPTETYLLSSSAYGRMIELWDWSSGWKKIQEFDIKTTYPDGVLSLKFNPRDTNTFACVTDDKSVKVGNIKSSSLTTKLTGPSKADYFFTRNDQHLMVTLSSRSHDAEIQDLETRKVVHTLGMSGQRTMLVAGHPTLPILVTALDDGTVCFWDANTYRLENKVRISDEPAHDWTLVTDVNDITRLVVTSKSMIAIMEVNLPKAITSERTGGRNYV